VNVFSIRKQNHYSETGHGKLFNANFLFPSLLFTMSYFLYTFSVWYVVSSGLHSIRINQVRSLHTSGWILFQLTTKVIYNELITYAVYTVYNAPLNKLRYNTSGFICQTIFPGNLFWKTWSLLIHDNDIPVDEINHCLRIAQILHMWAVNCKLPPYGNQ